MIRAIYKLYVVLTAAWKFRKTIWNFLRESDAISCNFAEFSKAYSSGASGANLAKQSLSNLLSLSTCSSFVLTTETVKDDQTLTKIKGLINGKYLFTIAWKIFLGDWNVNVKQSHWSAFIDRVKQKMPFVDKTKAVAGLASNDQTEAELTEQNEADVAELVGLLYFCSMIAPKLMKLKI